MKSILTKQSEIKIHLLVKWYYSDLMMTTFQILTKKDCSNSTTLLHWLKTENIQFEEWSMEKKETLEKLLHDPNYKENFCDIDSCYPHIPAVRVSNSGKYYFTGLDGIWDVYHLQKIVKEHLNE